MFSTTNTGGGIAGGSVNTSNTAFSGGSVVITIVNSTNNLNPTINGGGLGATNGNHGVGGYSPRIPCFYSLPGGGGGGGGTGTGGRGANSGWGSGGSGGGGGVTGGRGGDGGPGITIISAW
jgi:hypothetical protein